MPTFLDQFPSLEHLAFNCIQFVIRDCTDYIAFLSKCPLITNATFGIKTVTGFTITPEELLKALDTEGAEAFKATFTR
jgi:hypothetical protein